MRRQRSPLSTREELSHYCPQCGKQVTPPEMICITFGVLQCPHCGDPYSMMKLRTPQR